MLFVNTPLSAHVLLAGSFSYPHTWVGTTLSISVVTYIGYKATVDTASLDQLEADGYAQLIRDYLVALISALCVNIYIVGINQVRSVDLFAVVVIHSCVH